MKRRPAASPVPRRAGSPFLWVDLDPDIPLTTSQWADAYRILSPMTSAEPGRWRTARTPYLQEPLDAFADPAVTEITMRSSTQVGKTEFILNCLGYVIDYAPAPAMIVLPRDEDARGWASKRVKPMLANSPQLARHKTGRDDDTLGKAYILDRMFVKFAGANSPADLASDPCRYVFFDEVDKYPKFSGREADPVKLGTERTRTFWNHKICKVSTPTTNQGYITREYARSDQRRFWIPCPSCGEFQPLVFRREDGPGRGELRWPDKATPNEIVADGLAYYQCGICRAAIYETQKHAMLQRGVWCPAGGRVDADGILHDLPTPSPHRGYHLSALYSPWVSWSQIAAEFLDAKGTPALLMAFVNSVLGEPWQESFTPTAEKDLRNRQGIFPDGIVPNAAHVLTAGVDVQKDHFYFVIRAWGLMETSWLIRYGRVESWEDLMLVLKFTQYQRETGQGTLPVQLTCIDSAYRTNEVYAWCRKNYEAFRPTKGYQTQPGQPFRISHLDRDAAGRPIPGGMNLWTLSTEYYKDKLNRLIHTEPGSPGEWWLPNELTQEYIDHLTSEQKVIDRDRKTGKTTETWTPITESRANHLLDCEVGALAAADMLKVYLLRPAEQTQIYQPPRASSWLKGQRGAPTAEPPARLGGGGWIRRS